MLLFRVNFKLFCISYCILYAGHLCEMSLKYICAKRCEKKSKCWRWRELKCVSKSKVPFYSDLDMGQGLMQRLQKNMHIICLASLYVFFSEKHPPFVLPRALLRYLSWSRGAFASRRCSGKNCWIVSRWLKFEAKHRVRKPTASSNAQLSCPI